MAGSFWCFVFFFLHQPVLNPCKHLPSIRFCMRMCSCNFLTIIPRFFCVLGFGFVVVVFWGFFEGFCCCCCCFYKMLWFQWPEEGVGICFPFQESHSSSPADSNTSHLCQNNDLGEPAAAASLCLQESPVEWGACSGR